MKPVISVILPVYNGSRFLKEAIDSILNQTFSNFELIIINDGSTDETQAIISSYNDSRIRSFDKKNSGLIDTLLFGIKKCNADWIARMDADDICFPNRFEIQLQYISEEVAVIGSQALLIDENGIEYGRTKFENNHLGIMNKIENLFSNIIHPSVLINKRLLEKVGGYDPKMHVAEDFDLWLRISKIGKLINVNETLIKLRKHDDNISSKKLSVSVENCLISLVYYFNSKSTEIMSIDEYTLLKRSVSVTAENYCNNILEWENKKIKINSFSPFFKMIFLVVHPNILYNYLLIYVYKKNIVHELKKIQINNL